MRTRPVLAFMISVILITTVSVGCSPSPPPKSQSYERSYSKLLDVALLPPKERADALVALHAPWVVDRYSSQGRMPESMSEVVGGAIAGGGSITLGGPYVIERVSLVDVRPGKDEDMVWGGTLKETPFTDAPLRVAELIVTARGSEPSEFSDPDGSVEVGLFSVLLAKAENEWLLLSILPATTNEPRPARNLSSLASRRVGGNRPLLPNQPSDHVLPPPTDF